MQRCQSISSEINVLKGFMPLAKETIKENTYVPIRTIILWGTMYKGKDQVQDTHNHYLHYENYAENILSPPKVCHSR